MKKRMKNKEMIKKGCGKYLGYHHLSGAKAWCGDDVGTHIVYCKKCKKKAEEIYNE